MKTEKYHVAELSSAEMSEAKGGFLFLIIPVLVDTAAGCLLLVPIAASLLKGWNDYK